MALYTASQIFGYARQAGFSVDQAIKWTAIALAESGGSSRAHATKGEDSKGLWQINMRVHSGKLKGRDPYDPLVNAQLAYEISNHGTNAKPWTVTWPTRAGKPNPNFYGKYLAVAQQAAHPGGATARNEMGRPDAYNPPGSSTYRGTVNSVLPNVGTVVFPLQGYGPDMLSRSGIGDPRDGGSRKHKGLDLMAPFNTPIVAATNGVVRASGIGGGKFGWRVNIQDASGNIHSYAHMNKNPAEVGIREGMTVHAGQLIGYVGNSGTGGTAPHLHYSINEAQYASNKGRAIIDPYQVLKHGNLGTPGSAGMPDIGGEYSESMLTGSEAQRTAEDMFPQFMGFMTIPGVADIMAEAVRDNHGEGWLTNKLQQLPWWKETSEDRRLRQALKETDPATFDQKVKEKAEEILSVYETLGAKPPFEAFESVFGDKINRNSNFYKTAEAYYLGNISSREISRVVIRDTADPAKNIGKVASAMNELAGLAADYFVKYTPEQLEELAVRVVKGEYSPDQFMGLLKDQAKTLFAFDKNMMTQIDNGVSPGALFSTHRNVVANELEIDPDSVDFLSSKFYPILNFIDKTTGKNRSMTANETIQLAREQPEYESTQGAMENVASFTKAFEGIFGRG